MIRRLWVPVVSVNNEQIIGLVFVKDGHLVDWIRLDDANVLDEAPIVSGCSDEAHIHRLDRRFASKVAAVVNIGKTGFHLGGKGRQLDRLLACFRSRESALGWYRESVLRWQGHGVQHNGTPCVSILFHCYRAFHIPSGKIIEMIRGFILQNEVGSRYQRAFDCCMRKHRRVEG